MTVKRRRTGRAVIMAIASLVIATVGVEIGAYATSGSHNRRIASMDGRLFRRMNGNGPAVIFIHGFRGSSRYWGDHFDGLSGRRLIYIDLLGFGESPWPRTRYTTARHLNAIRDVAAPFVKDGGMTLVGHSLGAILALEYAREHRNEVDQLILLGLPVFESEREGRAKIEEMSSLAAAFSLRRVTARVSCDLVCALRPLLWRTAPYFDRTVPPDVARDAVLHRWASFEGTLQNVVLRSRAGDTLLQLRGLPVTIIQGRDDMVTNHDRLRALAAASGAELLFVDGDHNAFLRNTREITNLIAARLRAPNPPRRQQVPVRFDQPTSAGVVTTMSNFGGSTM